MVHSSRMVAGKPGLTRLGVQRVIADLTVSQERGRRYEKRIVLLKIGCPVILGKLAFRQINEIGYSTISVKMKQDLNP